MSAKTLFSTLSLLSLTFPFLGHAGNTWLFTGSEQPDATQTIIAANPQIVKTSNHEKNCRHKPFKKKLDYVLMLGVGYRHDRLSNRYTPSRSSPYQRVKFKYDDVDSVMGLARFDFRYSNLLLSIEGDYSPIVSGVMKAPFNIDTAVGSDFPFRFPKLTGYEADAMASIGYRLPFMNGYRSRAALIFQVGYRYSHQAYETEAQSRKTNGNFIGILQDQAPAHTEWFGPFLEGRFSFSYRDFFYFQPFYQYHFLDYRSRRHEAQMVFSYVNGSPPSASDFLVKFLSHGDDGRGQLGGIDIYYQPQREHLRVGVKGTYLDFHSRDTKTRTKIKDVSLDTNPTTSTTNKVKFHTHSDWHSYSIAAYAGYNF